MTQSRSAAMTSVAGASNSMIRKSLPLCTPVVVARPSAPSPPEKLITSIVTSPDVADEMLTNAVEP
jgi:hypothetical protein